MLEADNVSFAFGRKLVLADASLRISPGEVIGLGGPSGAGKSTLGRLLAGYLVPESGRVSVDGQTLSQGAFCPVQMLFQSPETAVNPRWRIQDILNEAFSPEPDMLDAFGIRPEWLVRYPHELSSGELQRVAIVRCLDPRVRYIIADEISASLDAITQAEIWQILLASARARKIGVLAISHDETLLARIASRRFELKGRRLNQASEPGRHDRAKAAVI